MAIITKDILLTGIRRDDVFEWMGDPANHDLIVAGAFDTVSGSTGHYELSLTTPGKKRTMSYRFKSKDDNPADGASWSTPRASGPRGELNQPPDHEALDQHAGHHPHGLQPGRCPGRTGQLGGTGSGAGERTGAHAREYRGLDPQSVGDC